MRRNSKRTLRQKSIPVPVYNLKHLTTRGKILWKVQSQTLVISTRLCRTTKHPDRLHSTLNPRQLNDLPGKGVHDKKIQLVVFCSHLAPREDVTKGVGLCAVNGRTINTDPSAHFQQDIFFKWHQAAVGTRPYVQQKVSASAYDIYQAFDFLVHFRLQRSPLLPATVPPRFLKNRGGGLPRHGQVVLRNLVVGHHAEIAKIVAQPATHHARRLQMRNQIVQFPALLHRQRPHIKPDFRDGPVAGQNLFYLAHIQAVVLRRNGICVVPGHRIGLRKMPIDKRKIDTKGYPSLPTRCSQTGHNIATVRCSLHNIKRRM